MQSNDKANIRGAVRNTLEISLRNYRMLYAKINVQQEI